MVAPLEQKPKITLRPDDWPVLTADLQNIEMVALEGAGVTGVVYTGALRALHEQGLLGKVKRFSGTSSGSIVALGAALGYRGAELESIALNQDFRSFCRTNGRWLRQMRQNFKRDGIFSGAEMRRWVSNLCARRIGQDALSFADLEEYRKQAEAGNRTFFEEKYKWAMEHKLHFRRHSLDRSQFTYDFECGTPKESIARMMEVAASFRSLEVAAAEVKEDERGNKSEHSALFNEKNTPNLTLASAVRASASYPFVFRNVQIEDDKGVVRSYTDGGFTQPIPMTSMDEEGIPNNRVLGFVSEYFPDKPQEVSHTPKVGWASKKLTSLIATAVGRKYIEKHGSEDRTSREVGLRLMDEATARFHERGKIRANNPHLMCRIIPLDRDGVDGKDFELTTSRKEQLIKSAYATTLNTIKP
ncbi:MAG: patatin-like phospholipase family protein [Rickettsiales bacterium]|nr:patatin-like phospholipase family protein [Rickettsiales bacterium]